MRKLLKRAMPVLCSIIIVLGTVFGSYTQAHATGLGITEMIYYTYWDLINTIYASCGYDVSVSDAQINNHGVTGKQAWDNFCTAVEGTAKFHGKLFKGCFEELKGLASNATAKGISMSQDLYDMLKDSLCDTSGSSGSTVGEFTVTDAGQYSRMIASLCSCSSYSDVGTLSYSMLGKQVASGHVKLSIIKGTNRFYLLELPKDAHSFSFEYDSKSGYSSLYYLDGRSYKCKYSGGGDIIDSSGRTIFTDMTFGTFSGHASWVLQNGHFFFDKSITAKQVSSNPPKVVPKVMKWTKCKDVPNIYRQVKLKEKEDHSIYVPGVGDVTNWDVWKDSLKDRTTTDAEEELWNSQYHFEDDNDDNDNKNDNNQDERLPAAIPIFADMGTKPDPEPDTEDSTENPDKDDDKKQDSSETTGSVFPMINPDTGNYVDPKTGYDIDPDTGYLIDPKTGDLIDPESGEVVQPGSGGGSGSGSGGSGISPPGKFSNITKYFPFCIPWDIMTLIKSMNAEKKAPHFTFEYHFDSIDYTFKIDVDMSDYWKYIKIFRWGMTIFFIIGLFFLTVKFTTFVYRMGG